MRRALLAAAALSAASGCASLDGVAAKKPDKGDIAKILLVENACRDAEGKACPAALQPAKAEIHDLKCATLPLRPAVPEVARARCSFSAILARGDGSTKDLGALVGEFGLNDYAPGAWAPVYQWARSKS
ncbi:MAG: hypothetical protein K2Q06_01600 [Parvularculaceae bacterium]|nr:hypothetical protein [Parvularculaceae bacterium]